MAITMKELPITEITLRKYEEARPQLTERELIRKLCLSLGLLQPGDSRDIIVDILYVLLQARQEKKLLKVEEVKNESIRLRQSLGLDIRGIADSNIRRQLKRLRDIFLAEKVKNSYRISEFSNLERIFEDKIEKYYIGSIIQRIKDYINKIEEKF